MIVEQLMKRVASIALIGSTVAIHSAESIRYETYSGAEINQFVSMLNHFRSYMYAEYPYLFRPTDPAAYSGAELYVPSAHTVVSCAFLGTQLIGCAIGMPLEEYPVNPEAAAECYASDVDYALLKEKNPHAFYFNEVLIDPEYRSIVDLDQLYNNMVNAVRVVFPACAVICFPKIDTSSDDQLRPDAYEASQGIERLENRMLVQQDFVATDDTLRMTWNTMQADGSVRMQEHALRLWKKSV